MFLTIYKVLAAILGGVPPVQEVADFEVVLRPS